MTWLRDFHDLVEGFRPTGSARGAAATSSWPADQIICHHDPGAYNWIIQSGHFVAMIDWDMAGPGGRSTTWPSWPGPRSRSIARSPSRTSSRRLDLLVDAYGEWGPMTVLDAVVERA